jgi:multiple sugar transport system substrate-binding protein
VNNFARLTSSALLAGAMATLGWSGAATAQDQVNLRMAIWSAAPAHLKLFNGIADDFAKTHPGVKVTFDSLPYDTYNTTLTTQIAGGNAPDLAWIFETSAPDFVNSGALYPVTDTFKATPDYNYGDLAAKPLALWQTGGTLYAYPFSTSPFAMFVNNDLIKAAGAQTPAELIKAGQWTWDNAIKTAAAVGKSGKAGLVVRDFNYQMWQDLAPVYFGWGARPWSEDGKTCSFTDPKMVDALTFFHDAVFKQKAIPGPGESVDFFAGDAAMTITQISRASLLPKDKPFNWDLVPLPAGPAGKYAIFGQAGIGVFKSSPNAKVAAEFLAYMTNPENSAKLAQFFPSPRQSLLNADALAKTNPLLSKAQLQSVVVDGIENGTVIPGHSGFAQIQQLVRAGLDAIWVPDADIGAAMQNICTRISPLLQH